MGDLTLLIVSYAIIAIVLIAVVLGMIKKQRHNSYKKELELLDREKNEIESAPVVSELAKLETIVKNDKMEEKYKSWFNSFEHIKNDSIPKINDMIIDLDLYIEKNDYKEYQINVAKTELAIYKAKMATDNLLDEIREINLSEEKYRKIVTKLKSKYRELLAAFEEKKALYEDIANVIELQFENIEKIMRDRKTGLYYHGYDESRKMNWADKKTGLSPCFWLRATGWFMSALTDTYEKLDGISEKAGRVFYRFFR